MVGVSKHANNNTTTLHIPDTWRSRVLMYGESGVLTGARVGATATIWDVSMIVPDAVTSGDLPSMSTSCVQQEYIDRQEIKAVTVGILLDLRKQQ